LFIRDDCVRKGALLSYDAHGNTTQIGNRTLTWDAADRNVSMTRAGVSSTWTRDATGRIRGRQLSGATVEQWRPGFDGDGDSPAFTRSATGAIGEIYQPLPGGVMFFKRIAPVVTEGDRWSYPNIHGDTLVTTDATGAAVTGLLTYSPDGRPLSGAAGNVVGSADYGWLGSHSRPAEDGATIIEMGARPYLPAIGRFLPIDPIEAGTPNDYAYPADPINQYDLTGAFSFDQSMPNTCNDIASCVSSWLKLISSNADVAGDLVLSGIKSMYCQAYACGTARGLEMVECFKQLGCGLATGTTMLLGGAVTAAACLGGAAAGPWGITAGCAAGGSLTGASVSAVMDATMYGTVSLCRVAIGAIAGGMSSGVAGRVNAPSLAAQSAGVSSSQSSAVVAFFARFSVGTGAKQTTRRC
jgi:RHS repeat-associated protein